MTLVRRLARPMLAALFVIEGLDTLRHPSSKEPKAGPFLDKVAGPLHLPDDHELLIRANAATMLAGGALLATGRMPRLASTALAASLVPTTVAGHAFWEESDPAAKRMQRIQFLKNVSMLGGLLLASVDTAGKPGLAYRAKLAGRDAGRAASLTKREAGHAASLTKRQARHAAKTAKREAKHAAKSARREAKLVASQAHDALT